MSTIEAESNEWISIQLMLSFEVDPRCYERRVFEMPFPKSIRLARNLRLCFGDGVDRDKDKAWRKLDEDSSEFSGMSSTYSNKISYH